MTENIVYHHNFYDNIREAKDAEKLRSILKKVETEIKERVGNNHYKFYKEASNEEKETIDRGGNPCSDFRHCGFPFLFCLLLLLYIILWINPC